MPLFGRRRGTEPPPPEDGGEAPGWDAIDAALRRLYGTAEPVHVAPMIPPSLGGPAASTGARRTPPTATGTT